MFAVRSFGTGRNSLAGSHKGENVFVGLWIACERHVGRARGWSGLLHVARAGPTRARGAECRVGRGARLERRVGHGRSAASLEADSTICPSRSDRRQRPSDVRHRYRCRRWAQRGGVRRRPRGRRQLAFARLLLLLLLLLLDLRLPPLLELLYERELWALDEVLQVFDLLHFRTTKANTVV